MNDQNQLHITQLNILSLFMIQ